MKTTTTTTTTKARLTPGDIAKARDAALRDAMRADHLATGYRLIGHLTEEAMTRAERRAARYAGVDAREIAAQAFDDIAIWFGSLADEHRPPTTKRPAWTPADAEKLGEYLTNDRRTINLIARQAHRIAERGTRGGSMPRLTAQEREIVARLKARGAEPFVIRTRTRYRDATPRERVLIERLATQWLRAEASRNGPITSGSSAFSPWLSVVGDSMPRAEHPHPAAEPLGIPGRQPSDIARLVWSRNPDYATEWLFEALAAYDATSPAIPKTANDRAYARRRRDPFKEIGARHGVSDVTAATILKTIATRTAKT